ncbi:MAG: NADH-quinone oxidoreductase subunit L [Rickettsiales bacterium]
MMDLNNIALLTVFLPLFGALIVGMNTKMPAHLAQVLTCVFVCVSALCSAYIFHQVNYLGGSVHLQLFKWFDVGDLVAHWSIFIDPLTSVMLIVVTGVSALVHIYSVGYMAHDEFKQRFMCYLSLFTFSMLMLVTADNFIQLFFGWEGVGLCSYLLIGFWFLKDTASAAAIKAFLVNRVGDFGFALGIFLIFWTMGSVEYAQVFAVANQFSEDSVSFFGLEVNLITMACLLLFMGAMGKSAQIGLHTWLPDAMEGPTPVSALIHAATMVTAGVFMVARCSPLFELSPVALSVVTMVGAVTCLFAASIALVQNDIKRIIAYSTCSQLGYMFFACGVSAYAAGIFHLMTHGFFKALLFLGAGSVIHAMSDEQDIRKMGGIYKLIPYTYVMMWIGSLALAGIFPFAGFYSKDIILEAAYASGTIHGQLAYWMGILAAVFTAFYSWRLLILTFHGKPRASKKTMEHVHESPFNMMIPLMLLSIGSIVAGYWGSQMLHLTDGEGTFWRGSIMVLAANNSLEAAHHVAPWVALMPLFAGIVGISTAFLMYIISPRLPEQLYGKAKGIYTILLNKWYVDELYEAVFINPSKRLGRFLWKIIDNVFIDGMPNGAAAITQSFSRFTSYIQTGFIYHYAFVMLLGLVCIITWVVFITG